jgi:formate C-acetyltransferase
MVTQKGKEITDYDGGHPLPAALVLTWAFTLAPMTGALTNGRKRGDLLADGGGPHAGYDRNGPMSAVLSVAKMDSRNIRMIIFNQKFDSVSVAGDTGLQKLKSHIEAAMRQDVEMIQFNIVDREELLEAQERPQEYEDLVVRVSGYNVRFVDLTKTLQDGIIARTQHTI